MTKTAVLTLALLLAACSGADKGAEGERKGAAGEVLGGTITDDMLPLDTVTSQSPPLRETGEGEGSGGSADADDGATAPPRDSEGGPGEPPRDPAPSPAPEAKQPEEPAAE